jgi:hypothetical protein
MVDAGKFALTCPQSGTFGRSAALASHDWFVIRLSLASFA